MKITPKLRKIINERLLKKEYGYDWLGDHDEHGMPTVKYMGKVYLVEDIAHHMGIKFPKLTKYEEEHEGMERTITSGDHEDAGDGDSESEQ